MFGNICLWYNSLLLLKYHMQDILTISHQCPICEDKGLTLIFERALVFEHETVCENENYSHIKMNGKDYFVRKSRNILAEIRDTAFHMERSLI